MGQNRSMRPSPPGPSPRPSPPSTGEREPHFDGARFAPQKSYARARSLCARDEPADDDGLVTKVLGSAAFRSFARSAASSLGREITRGLFGTRRRRR